jgi:sugar lactone lactonase YvrE
MNADKSKLSRVVGHFCASALIFLASSQANASDDSQVAARANLERIQSLRKQRPDDGLLVFYEGMIRIGLGERDTAFTLLRSLKGRKLGLIPVRDAGFELVWGDPEFQKLCKELADDEPRTRNAPMAFHLTDTKLIPEGIAYDSKRDRFFIGSVAQKKIVVTNRKGEARDFSKPEDNLDCILGLTVDHTRDHLWTVSTNGFLDEAKTKRRNALVCYDLKTGRLAARFEAPEAMQLNDLAIAPSGIIYATDSMSGALFRKEPDEKTLTPFGSKGAVAGANGITLGADGSLYVAISTGIAKVDTSTGAPTRLPQPDTVVTGGCDGLYCYEGDLIGIQNVTNPGRVVRIQLADKGERVAGLIVLQSNRHPDFAEPTTGTIAHGALYVIANSYVGHFQPDGTTKDKDQLKGTVIVSVPLTP